MEEPRQCEDEEPNQHGDAEWRTAIDIRPEELEDPQKEPACHQGGGLPDAHSCILPETERVQMPFWKTDLRQCPCGTRRLTTKLTDDRFRPDVGRSAGGADP